MADNLVVDEGTSAKKARTVERTANIHNPVVELNVGGASEVLAGGDANGLKVQGPVAGDVAVAGSPLIIGGRASGATPSDVSADGDAVHGWYDLKGRLHTVVDNSVITGTAGTPNAGVLSVQGVSGGYALPCDVGGQQVIAVPNVDPGSMNQVWKHGNYTSAQTGTALWTPSSGFRVAVTGIIIGTYGTTTGKVTVFFSASADTAYTIGTDHPVLCATFSPSATAKPGLVFAPAMPVFGWDVDYVLRITTDAALSIDIVVHGYEW
jgi:hypothetical protein